MADAQAYLPDRLADLEPKQSGLHRSTATFFRFTPDGKKADSLTSVPSWEALVEVASESIRFTTVPFSRSLRAAILGPDVLLAETEWFGFAVFRPGIGTRRIVRINLPTRPLTASMYEAAVDRQLEAWGDARPEDRAKERTKVLAVSRPEAVPAIDQLVTTADRRVWLRQYLVDPDAPTRFAVLDSTGGFAGFITGPAKFRPTWIGSDLAVGIWLDADDVAHIRGYRLRVRSP